MKKIYIILNIALLIMCILYIALTYIKETKTITSIHAKLLPIEADKARINYPFVRIPEYDPLYKYIVLEEKIDTYLHKDKQLFQSKKRISELLKWGNVIEVNHVVGDTDIKNSTYLIKKWWNTKDASWLSNESSATFNSWESVLARYIGHIDAYANDLLDIQRRFTVVRELGEDRSVLLESIRQMNLDPKDLRYILSITTNLFEDMNKKYSLSNGVYSDSQFTLFFDSRSIIQSSPKATFNIYIDPQNMPIQQGLVLTSNNSTYQAILPSDTQTFIVFRNVLIDANHPILSLKYQAPTPIPLTQFKVRTPQTKAEKVWYIFRYEPETNLSSYDNQIHVSTQTNTVNELLIKKNSTFNNDYINRVEAKKEILLSGPINTTEVKKYTKTISTGVETLSSYDIGLSYDVLSKHPEQPDISRDTVTVIPILRPEILLDSTFISPYSFSTVNTVNEFKNIGTAFITLNLLLFIASVLLRRRIFTYDLLFKFAKKHQVALFNIFVGLMLINFIFLKDTYIFITYLLIALWLLFRWGSAINPRMYFPLATSFLLISFISSRLGLSSLAEKSATWTYIYLFIGLISIIIHRESNTYISLPAFLIKKEYPYFRPLVTYALFIAAQITRFLKWAFNFHPKTSFDHLRNGIVLILFIIIPVLTNVTIKTISKTIDRSNQNPVITSIQPTIVYNSNKIVLDGKRFGWNSSNKHSAYLMSNIGKLDVSLWTDTQLIIEVPLKVTPGTLHLWIEKPILWEGALTTAKSNSVSVKIISRTDGWDKEDDAYFDQMEKLPSTIKSLNGY